jgi:hypothetical protein
MRRNPPSGWGVRLALGAHKLLDDAVQLGQIALVMGVYFGKILLWSS